MLREGSVRYFTEIHELQTELSAFEARGVTNFGTRCIINEVAPDRMEFESLTSAVARYLA